MRSASLLLMRQTSLVGLGVLAYFSVRGLTEAGIAVAIRNAGWVLDAERFVGVDIELGVQESFLVHQPIVNIANWIYIWGHWPILAGTLIWLVFAHRDEFYELRNAIFFSGAIGLVIFAGFPVAPPRIFDSGYVDTVLEHSGAYRVLQPPSLVNKFAAVPSLHFGWNLLVGLTWHRVGRTVPSSVAGVIMPAAMAFAVVVTANHWILDVLAGGAVALAGLWLERTRQRYVRGRKSEPGASPDQAPGTVEIDLSDNAGDSPRSAWQTADHAP